MIDFKEMNSAEDINQLLSSKALNHTYYYHYSNIEGIEGILSGKTIWVSSMCFSNDATEHNRFGDDTYRYFQLCFSTGTTENLPLWFLYSGKNGRGMRITFPKKVINKLFLEDDIDIALVNVDTKERIKLIPDKNCKVYFKDVLYRKSEGKKYRLKYNTKVNNEFPAEEMDKVYAENKGFVKEIIWFYEKETRLLVEVSEDIIDKVLFKNADKSPYRVELHIPEECYKHIDITFSPAYSQDDCSEIDNILQRNAFSALNRAKVLSEYAGSIKIDLCKNCDQTQKR